MTIGNSKQPNRKVRGQEMLKYFDLLEKAKLENLHFSNLAWKLYDWTGNYQIDQGISADFLEWYQGLFDCVKESSESVAQFTDTQKEILDSLIVRMKTIGLISKIPKSAELTYRISQISSSYPYSSILASSFTSTLIEVSEMDVDIHRFLYLLSLAMKKTSHEISEAAERNGIDAIILQVTKNDIYNHIIRDFSCALLEAFWQNPDVVQYGKKWIEVAWRKPL